MDFSVNTRAVVGLADALDMRAHNLTGAAGYLQEQSTLRFGSGLINELFQTHERIMATVEAFLRHAGDDYAAQYARGVGQAARSYTTSDASASARLDASLPGVIDPTISAHLADQSVGPEIFADPSCLALQLPPDYESEYPYEPDWYDLLSPTSIVRDVVWYVTSLLTKLGLLPEPCDPYETFTRPLCGDWAGLERVSFALTEVARALTYVSARIDTEARTLDRVWTGHAASNCRSALLRFAHDLHPAVDIVVQIAADYHEVAVRARAQGKALGTAVSTLVDLCGSLGVETGVELAAEALGDASTLGRIGKAVDTVLSDGRTMVELLAAVIHARHGHLEDLCQQIGILTLQPLAVNLPDDQPALPAPAQR
jgi:hypothetical protein